MYKYQYYKKTHSGPNKGTVSFTINRWGRLATVASGGTLNAGLYLTAPARKSKTENLAVAFYPTFDAKGRIKVC